ALQRRDPRRARRGTPAPAHSTTANWITREPDPVRAPAPRASMERAEVHVGRADDDVVEIAAMVEIGAVLLQECAHLLGAAVEMEHAVLADVRRGVGGFALAVLRKAREVRAVGRDVALGRDPVDLDAAELRARHAPAEKAAAFERRILEDAPV